MPIILLVQRDRVRAEPEVFAEFGNEHGVAQLAEHVGALQKVRVVDLAAGAAPGREVLHRDFHQHDGLLAHDLLFL